MNRLGCFGSGNVTIGGTMRVSSGTVVMRREPLFAAAGEAELGEP